MEEFVKSITIGPLNYRVKFTDNLVSKEGVNLAGQIDYQKCLISLDSSLCDQTRIVILWHEIVHGLFDNAGVNKHNEGLIDALSHSLVQFLRANPQVVEITMNGGQDT